MYENMRFMYIKENGREYCYAQQFSTSPTSIQPTTSPAISKQCVDSNDNVDSTSISQALIIDNESNENEYCGIAKVQSSCPVACGTCCKDDENYRLKVS